MLLRICVTYNVNQRENGGFTRKVVIDWDLSADVLINDSKIGAWITRMSLWFMADNKYS